MIKELEKRREIWDNKKILREIYTDWYKIILKDLKPGGGKTVELGAGSGNFKKFKPDVISSDIIECEWLDICFDAHNMPFDKDSISNIVMIDVLHHLADPVKFFKEAIRVLEKEGRIIIIEPFPTLFSFAVYKKYHSEPFIMNIDYFSPIFTTDKDPFDSNQAIAYLLFYRNYKAFIKEFGMNLKLIKKYKFSYLLYPLSGGFSNKSFIPDFLISLFRFFERILTPFNSLLAFRCYILLERK